MVDLDQTEKRKNDTFQMRLRSVFKMRMSILNTATTEQMECIIFSFFVYSKPTVGVKSQTFGQSPLSHRQKY